MKTIWQICLCKSQPRSDFCSFVNVLAVDGSIDGERQNRGLEPWPDSGQHTHTPTESVCSPAPHPTLVLSSEPHPGRGEGEVGAGGSIVDRGGEERPRVAGLTCRGEQEAGAATAETVKQPLSSDVGVEEGGGAAELGQAEPGGQEERPVGQQQRRAVPWTQRGGRQQSPAQPVAVGVQLAVGQLPALEQQQQLVRVLPRPLQQHIEQGWGRPPVGPPPQPQRRHQRPAHHRHLRP